MTKNIYLKLKLFKRKISFQALYPYKGTRKVKDLQKLSNKEIYFTLQPNSTIQYNIPFKFIPWPNFLEGHHILSQESFDGYVFSAWYKLIHFFLPLNPAMHRIATQQRFCVPVQM